MRGLALEGGGARGAYQIGVVKAYLENGYVFDGFVGTSIGAINAAILAQGDFDLAMELWQKVSMEQIFDTEDSRLITLGEGKFAINLPADLGKSLKKIISSKGVDTTKIRAFLEQYIDEDKVRSSGKEFGLVTVSIDERKAYEVFLDEIPEGKLINYIMASAAAPGFMLEVIDEKKFIDGGLYNNCPINLLVDKGYDEIIAIRTGALGIFRKVDKSANVKIISSDEDLGELFLFSPEISEANIKRGYYDGLQVIQNLSGRRYYLSGICMDRICTVLMSLTDKEILKIGHILELPLKPAKRLLFELIIPHLGAYLKLEKDFNYTDFVVALLEYSAEQKMVERFQVYSYDQFVSHIKNRPLPKKEEPLLGTLFQSKKEKAVEAFVECLLNK